MKEFLSSKDISYKDHDVSIDTLAAQDIMRLTGQNGVPVTVIDGQTVVGFDQPRLEWLIAQAPAQTGIPFKFGAAIADLGKAGREGLLINFGAYIGRIKSGSIAEKAGLSIGDVVIQMNKQAINGAGDVEHFIANIKQGETLYIVFIRGNTVNKAEIPI